MLSDSTEFTEAVDVQPAANLPRWQTVYVPQYAAWEAPESQWGNTNADTFGANVQHYAVPSAPPREHDESAALLGATTNTYRDLSMNPPQQA